MKYIAATALSISTCLSAAFADTTGDLSQISHYHDIFNQGAIDAIAKANDMTKFVRMNYVVNYSGETSSDFYVIYTDNHGGAWMITKWYEDDEYYRILYSGESYKIEAEPHVMPYQYQGHEYCPQKNVMRFRESTRLSASFVNIDDGFTYRLFIGTGDRDNSITMSPNNGYLMKDPRPIRDDQCTQLAEVSYAPFPHNEASLRP